MPYRHPHPQWDELDLQTVNSASRDPLILRVLSPLGDAGRCTSETGSPSQEVRLREAGVRPTLGLRVFLVNARGRPTHLSCAATLLL